MCGVRTELSLLHLYCNDLRTFLHHCCQRRTSATRGRQRRDFQLLLLFKFRCRCNPLRLVKDMTQKYPECLEPSSKRQERVSCLHCSAAEHWGGRQGCRQAMCLVGLSGSLQVDQQKLSLRGNDAPVRRTAISQDGNNNRRLMSSQHESHLVGMICKCQYDCHNGSYTMGGSNNMWWVCILLSDPITGQEGKS